VSPQWTGIYGFLSSCLTITRAEDKSTRYVAEENIEILHESPPVVLMEMAGRYFKRWDDEEKKFVSNIVDDYPDD
jgi:F-box protein 21